MTHTYYALYDKKTAEPMSVSGVSYDKISDGYAMCMVHSADGEDFILGRKKFNQYFVKVDSSGFAEFCLRGVWYEGFKRNKFDSNLIHDLNPNDTFFDYLQISVKQSENIVELLGDEKIIEAASTNLKYNDIGQFTLYVTLYGNPSALVSMIKLDLKEFFTNLSYTFEIPTTKKISVWGSR